MSGLVENTNFCPEDFQGIIFSEDNSVVYCATCGKSKNIKFLCLVIWTSGLRGKFSCPDPYCPVFYKIGSNFKNVKSL